MAEHVPVPGVDPLPGSRILEGFVLQPRRPEAERPADGEESLLVRADEMSHRFIADAPAMKPNAAVEGEAHPLAAAFEFTPGSTYWQATLPSTVAGPSGPALP